MEDLGLFGAGYVIGMVIGLAGGIAIGAKKDKLTPKQK